MLGDAGWSRGLVTTAEITHATPAGFAANSGSRDHAQLIAAQYLDRRIEVLLGGGRQFFDAAKRLDKRDLKAAYAKAGYAVVETRQDLETACCSKPLLGMFADSHLPYTIDHEADGGLRGRVPTLAGMVKAALARLGSAPHFILQVEGGRVDHAAHNSDAAAAIRDQIALDEAIEVCLAFQKENPDTLIVATTDHGNSNLGLNGMGGGYSLSAAYFAHLAAVRASAPEILAAIKKRGHTIRVEPSKALERAEALPYMAPKKDSQYEDEEAYEALVAEAAKKAKKDPAKDTRPEALYIETKELVETIEEYTGYRVPKARAALFGRFLLRKGRALYDQMNSETTQFGQLMANRLGIGWTGNSHTADHVPIVAVGPGAERLAGVIDNTDVFARYTEFAGLSFRNTAMPEFAAADGVAALESVTEYGQPFRERLPA